MKHPDGGREILNFYSSRNLVLDFLRDLSTGEKVWLATTLSAMEIYYRPVTLLQAVELCQEYQVGAEVIQKLESEES
ncbi:MAG TPA: hypothetical protein P5328_02090 [Candidatus Paceibacterota bacterium]|nr:hypothetical protein [Candidatus Paceibacterota bacterium]HRZ34458.1 hypothetical protein [Candidatus Paceibacterota bacterium]